MNIDDLPKDVNAESENLENDANVESTDDAQVEFKEVNTESETPKTEGSNEEASPVENKEVEEPSADGIESTEETEVVDEKLSLEDVISESDKPALPAIKQEKKRDAKRWYSLRVISGKEKKIKERIELEISRRKWGESVTQILVPSEKVYKIRNGKKVILERNILPGYILVEAIPERFSGEMIQTISGMTNVIHFLGKTKPIPMQPSEANRMLGKVDESQEVGESMLEPFIVGETVKIIDGPFNDFVGDIKEVNEEKKKLKVIVKIFGRGTEVELNFMQVEKTS